VTYLSASAVVIHYEEVLYQVYGPLPFRIIPMSNYVTNIHKPASIIAIYFHQCLIVDGFCTINHCFFDWNPEHENLNMAL